MDLKEARYILAIAEYRNIGKAAESLFISQPSLSKYLKNLEQQLGAPLFSRINNTYVPTYMGERYLHYAAQIAALGEQWQREYDDITHHASGRLGIAVPIMLGSVLIHPTLSLFHKQYPNVTINVMEENNFVAEHSLEDHSIDLTFYNVHEFPKNLDYQILKTEELVLILAEDHPIGAQAVEKPGFAYPWLDLKLLEKEPFILLYPDQNTGILALKLFDQYRIQPEVLLHTRSSQMSIQLAMDGMGAAFAPAGYYHYLAKHRPDHPRCYSIGTEPVRSTVIAAYDPKRYLPQYARDYIGLLKDYCSKELP
jgi:DNA-binding transcriptional LysR family regulator